MLVLALSSSSTHASVALVSDHLRSERHHEKPRGHVEFINQAIQDLLDESGHQLSDLELIAIDRGPGSFTGLRVAVSVARSLCYSLSRPAFVTESSAILSWNKPLPTFVGINAFRNLLFAQIVEERSNPETLQVVSPQDFEREISQRFSPQVNLTFVGDGWSVYQAEWTESFRARMTLPTHDGLFPSALRLGEMALVSSPSAWIQDWKLIVPLYLRESAAEENLRKTEK